ncbi:T9SS C-terminal target domain-containing protein [Dokdonia sinensis]|uniref:T9SS C-terminal target domain-containing protein n=1 Tax=Dokdonia sinensis TaxID=2479847 RepID=A0A3M0G973_9FLAO|nr:endonuclease [Dokdonia sinensis]RMB57649.1 T9SS C-terminal target domain-containing protein [Dokdonia sinensis]
MKKSLVFAFLLLFSATLFAQVTINELDSDTPSTDRLEIIELLTETPEMSLDGFVLVLFNGSDSGGDSSYFVLDLDGLVSDVNGIVLIGNNDVSPVPDFILFDSTIQNGADAVAIYAGDDTDFPEFTVATTTNLIDALVYDTNDSDDTDLLALLGETEQINEGGNGPSDTNSIQADGTGGYNVTLPTPGALNDGSGVIFNLVGYTVAQEQYDEGDAIDIVFTTTENVTEDTTFTFTLDNEGFDTDDFTGATEIIILSGENTATRTITTIDDSEDEGDEVMKITFGDLPDGFKRANDNLEVRIVDNDFTMASWGTPLNPTFDQVESTQPNGYYDPIDGLADDALVQAIQDIIADPDVVRAQTYADVIDILKRADQSPLNSNQVWLVYTEQQRPKLDFQTSGGSNTGLWNREHTYPRSRGGFFDIEADEIADGIDIFFPTKADSLRHANSDAHGLRAADGPENSSRGNQDYGEYSGPTGNQGSFYGDVARSIFFLTIRYNGIDVVSGNPANSTVGQLGDLDVLLEWHRNDPPDDYEMNRNNVVYEWQFNRNPFIDMPDLAEYIWGNNVGDTWTNPLRVDEFSAVDVRVYPNPSNRTFTITAPQLSGEAIIYDQTGRRIHSYPFKNIMVLNHNYPSGVYYVTLTSDIGTVTKRLIVR